MSSTAAALDIILIDALDAVNCAQTAERLAIESVRIASEQNNAAALFAAKESAVAAIRTLTAARDTLHKLVDLRAQFRA